MHDLTDKLSVLSRGEGDEEQIPEGMSPKVVEVYKSLGKIMSRYSTGKVPKAFKIIPNLKQWEEVNTPINLLASQCPAVKSKACVLCTGWQN